MSRGSIKSDPITCNEDTSSISARSDTSVDSYVFDPSFGKYFYLFETQAALTIKQLYSLSLAVTVHVDLRNK